ncbi:MAG: sigma-70 family RNA polymerase sigma factor [Gemmataceae bacterium]|nr:sigma-70 family RNA polymerase sigma factor [Gemmataceae bacterium]
MAKEAGFVPARNELVLRLWPEIKSLIPILARDKGLSAEDKEDIRQQSFFWIDEAIRCYDAFQSVKPAGCTFRTFVRRVVSRRLRDWFRARHRYERRIHSPVGRVTLARVDCDLDEAAEWRELQLAVGEAVQSLDAPDRLIWEGLCGGKKLRDLPTMMGVSYRTVRRRWQRVKGQVGAILRGE